MPSDLSGISPSPQLSSQALTICSYDPNISSENSPSE
uniref:Uncharacterized protein n=1 Tax=Rhizophora mucronata TaxID=61149 RepID=A0A2P2QCQ2_RHIMU